MLLELGVGRREARCATGEDADGLGAGGGRARRRRRCRRCSRRAWRPGRPRARAREPASSRGRTRRRRTCGWSTAVRPALSAHPGRLGRTRARLSAMSRTVTSIIAGRAATDAPGRPSRPPPTRPTPTRSSPTSLLGDAGTFVAACEAARAAQREWAAVPAPVRGRAIQQIGRLVEDNKEALARLVTREIGKPYAESLGEVQEIVDTCNFFLGEGRRLYGQTVPSEMPDKQLFTFRVPVGVAAIITAGNFPVAVPSWYLVPALLCGNAVVWKPAEYAPAIGRGAGPAVPARRAARRRPEPRAGRRPADLRRPRAGARPRPRRQGRLHRLERRRARGSASCAGATCSRRASSSAARTRWSSWTTPTSTSPSRARCSAASAPPASAARRWAR